MGSCSPSGRVNWALRAQSQVASMMVFVELKFAELQGETWSVY